MSPSRPESELAAEPLSIYLEQASQYELLSAEQEVELAQCMEEGASAADELQDKVSQNGGTEGLDTSHLEQAIQAGNEAKQAFINANLRLVVSVAKRRHRYGSTGVDFLDTIQAGNNGLIRAVEKFDWRKGFKFSTYATWWIKQAIDRNYRDHARTIRLPAHIGDKLVDINIAKDSLAKKNIDNPTLEQLANESGIDAAVVERTLDSVYVSEELVSLDTLIGDDGVSLEYFVEDKTVDVVGRATANLISTELLSLLEVLAEREQVVIRGRYGLDGGEPKTLEEIGQDMGITRERVRQLEKVALAKLRHEGDKRGSLRDTA